MESVAMTATMRLMDWRSLDTRLLWAYQGPAGAPAGTFRNSHLVAWRLLCGRVEVRGAATTRHAKAGEWMFPPSGHDARLFSADAELISIHFQARWPDGRLMFEEAEPACCDAADFPELDRAAAAVLAELRAAFPSPSENLSQDQTDLFNYLKIENTLPGWLSAYARARLRSGARLVLQGTAEPRVLQGLEILNNWPLEKPLPLSLLAARLHLSVSQLNRLFSAETGKTALRHFEDQRLEAARNLLRTSTLQVKEVAYAVGFKQPAHFSNWFFKKTGSFPLSCRREILPPSRCG